MGAVSSSEEKNNLDNDKEKKYGVFNKEFEKMNVCRMETDIIPSEVLSLPPLATKPA
jgi:hypothetical protein